ncbi:MAG: biotin/lipoyl-containing protein, partial [Candidatus Dormiibacterota bacterium]
MGVTPIKMPQLGESVTEGTVDRWLKHEGDYVRRDEPLVEVVTDKVNAEVPSPFEGTLRKIDIQEGATVPIGAVIAQMETEGGIAVSADPQPATNSATAATAPAPRPATTPSPAAASAPPPNAVASAGPPPRYSPAVRRLAQEHELDLAAISGSGHNGRITRDDVQGFVKTAIASPAASGGGVHAGTTTGLG